MTGLQPSLKSRHRLSLNWSYLNAIADGVSAIDLGALALRTLSDARQFAREYGFDIDNPTVWAQIGDAHREAIAFIRETFLDPARRDAIPPDVADAPDPLQLLVFASRNAQRADPLRLWSCATLKVMHGIFYIDNNLKLRHFNAIREQVFASLEEVIRHEDGRDFLFDGETCLPLLNVERKHNKGRYSILLKLLQKAAYVAADVFDHLGLRLTLATRFECLLALELLRRAHVVSVTNVDAGRTRNTLLDLAAAKQIFARYRALIDRSDEYPTELLKTMDAELAELAAPQTRADNPHSGSGFSSLQVTVRKMIHLSDGSGFFFEYEIQLMDAASHQRSLHGPASHESYKQRQVETARRRVFGPELLALLEMPLKSPVAAQPRDASASPVAGNPRTHPAL